MVVAHSFQGIFEESCKTSVLSLPACKQNNLIINYNYDDNFQTVYNGEAPILPFAHSQLFYANITDWRRFTATNSGCKAVYEVTFDVEGSNFNFKAGDTIGIVPRNNDAEVEAVIDHLNLRPQVDAMYTLSIDSSVKGAKIPAHIPIKCTLRHVLTHCVDIRSIIKKLFLLILSRHTKNENERKVLEYLCSKEGSKAYTDHILNGRLCILDIFSIFKSCKPPIEVVLANLPRLLPRQYSVVNSALKVASELKICFSVIDTGNSRKGLATGWLERLILNVGYNFENGLRNLCINNSCNRRIDCKVPIYIRKNLTGFNSPQNLDSPLILIGPGTGVAPFIAFLEEREYFKGKDTELKLGDVWLFFGCRNPKLDFIYENELNDFLSKGVLNKLIVAFSRMENNDIKYVQDALVQNGEDITKLLKDGASIFICGDLKVMASQVREALVKCLVKHSDVSVEEAANYLSNLEKEKRYFVDIWS